MPDLSTVPSGIVPAAIRSRRVAQEYGPDLELLEAAPVGSERGAPVLLVHGAFTGAWCWRETFLGTFARAGRRVQALSLRGHGHSDGRRDLRRATLEDYMMDVASVAAAMPEPPVVVGHSLGGYLAQLLIGLTPMRAVVMLGSLPPDGLALVGPRLAMSDPKFWLEGVVGSLARSKSAAEIAGLDVLFGNDVGPADRQRYARLMVPESPLALAQAHAPRPIYPAAFAGLPGLVVQGDSDRLIWPPTAFRTAAYHGADHLVLPETGHLVMLGTEAAACAGSVLAWLADRRI